MPLLTAYLPRFIEQITTYHPSDATEIHHQERMLAFLQTQSAPFARTTQAGHITASAVLVDENLAHVGLIWHAKLGRWFQAGGHCEPHIDSTVAEAALRELLEETLLPPDAAQLLQSSPFDLDVHLISARPDEPDHWHYDTRYLFQAPYAALPQTTVCLWKPLAEVLADSDESRARFARKIAGLAQKNSPTPSS